jgi:hypothetical protein
MHYLRMEVAGLGHFYQEHFNFQATSNLPTKSQLIQHAAAEVNS